MRPAAPSRPPRDLRLDVLRGWMQVSIFISHAVGTGFAWGIHAAWGVSDSSEQFVLLSGLALGSVFSLKWARLGYGAALQDLGGRLRKLWVTHLVVFFLFGGMVFLLAPGELGKLGWGWLASAPWFAVPAAGTLLYQPDFMGILPVFLWCMLLLPGFLWVMERIGDWALALPFGVYAATQVFGLLPPGLGGTEIAFDPFAWQVLFLTGAWLGRRALYGAQPLPRPVWAVSLAVGVLLVGLWFKLGQHGILTPAQDWVLALTTKQTLAPLRLAHALALAWLVAICLPREAGWMHGALPRALASIGRNSLQVFCLGLFLSWGAALAFRTWPQQLLPLDLGLIPLGVLVLVGYARWLEGQRAPAGPGYSVATAASQ